MSQQQQQQQPQDAPRPGHRSSSKSGEEKSRISVIEKSVTHLLVATKTLLETLTRWSKHTATESEVSDVYVRLGYEFNIACRAFNSIGVDTQDLGPVPDLLRSILEETLSGEPSQAHLDKYLPRIRDIIVNLLQGLKKKQQRLRQRHGRDSSSNSSTQDPRQNDPGANPSATHESSSRQASHTTSQRKESTNAPPNGDSVHPRSSSTAAKDAAAQTRNEFDKGGSVPAAEDQNYAFAGPGTSSSVYSTAQDTTFPSYPQGDTIPGKYPTDFVNNPTASEPTPSSNQPKQGDALAQLQRGGELERRASRRFSAYHIQKHLGPSTGIPMIPPTQTSPIPNRGRDVRESMNAVRVRENQLQSSTSSRKPINGSPGGRQESSRQGTPAPSTLSTMTSGPAFETSAEQPALGSPFAVTPDDKVRQSYFEPDDEKAQTTDPTIQLRATHVDSSTTAVSPPIANGTSLERGRPINVPMRRSSRKQNDLVGMAQPERPGSGKELTLFLQYKTKIKKFVLTEGYEELSIARLQLAFIEKFAWNTNSNGLDLPEIYIQDPVSGVRHELEDLSDVKNHSVLALNVDAVEEVKKHLDDGMGGLKAMLQEVRSAIAEHQTALQRVSDKQQDANKEMTRLATAPPSTQINSSLTRGAFPKQGSEIQSLRRDLAVMRQTYTASLADMELSIKNLREKATEMKSSASAEPSFPSAADTDSTSETNSGRSYVNSGRQTLNSTSETLMTRVEELQDTVEDLRKDVVTRGVRPLPRQLETVAREISTSTGELKKLQEFIKREKPTWTKIWKDELQVVCDDQNLLTYQEELCADLEADLEAAAQTFGLVQEATKQQNLVNNATAHGPAAGGPLAASTLSGRSSSRTLNPAADPIKAKDGVLGEVRALQPNHESRLEAIERAEKLRQRELESRKDGEFQKELSGFVDEGKLKKSGGFEEAERMRKAKDEMARKEFWERVNGGRSVGGPSPSPSPAPEAQQQDAKEAEKAVSGAAVPPPLDVSDAKDVTPVTPPDSKFEDALEVPQIPEIPLSAMSSFLAQ